MTIHYYKITYFMIIWIQYHSEEYFKGIHGRQTEGIVQA